MTISIERNNMVTPSKIVPLHHEKNISDECPRKRFMKSCIPSFNDGPRKPERRPTTTKLVELEKYTFSSRPATIISYVESRKNLCKKERERRWLATEEFTKVKSQCRQEVLRFKNSDNGADII